VKELHAVPKLLVAHHWLVGQTAAARRATRMVYGDGCVRRRPTQARHSVGSLPYFVNVKRARRVVPSRKVTTRSRQVPAHALAVPARKV
jgi:hypothetical protein